MDTKRCPKCKETKSVLEFHITKLSKSGYSSWCKQCNHLKSHNWYLNNKKRKCELAMQWAKNNPEKWKQVQKKALQKTWSKVKEIKELIFKSNPCPHCKENRSCCLEFHHLNSDTKEKCVARCNTVRILLIEIAKCVVLCANCHRLLHAGYWQLSLDTKPIDISPYINQCTNRAPMTNVGLQNTTFEPAVLSPPLNSCSN